MKHFFNFVTLLFIYLLPSSSYTQNPILPTPFSLFNSIDKIAASEKIYKSKVHKSNNLIGNNYDLKYHRFDWFINPDTFYIKGSVKSIFVTTKNNVSEISFELNDSLKVDSVKNGNVNLTFNHQSSNLQIFLTANLSLSQLDSVTVYYHGVPYNNSGFGSFVKNFHSKTNKTPVIWSLSEPYGSKDWWPCKSSLNDKIDSIDIFVTTPEQYRAASNGILVSEILKGKDKTYHWKHRYPIAAYLIAIAVTNYAVYSHFVPLADNKQLEVLNYIYPEDTAKLFPYTKQAVGFIEFFNKLFIPYPFIKEKYGHTEIGWPGGMEHQTMTFLGIDAFDFNIVSHELAHQWFGDMVTCGDWHDLWLNEGFATYCSGLCCEYLLPPPISDYWHIWKTKVISKVISKPGGSVFPKDTANVDLLFDSRLTYYKGAVVLHMLRWIVGDSNFFQGVRAYLKDPKLSYGYAKTEDLKSHIELKSGMDLTYFFNDWYYGEGYPIYNVNAVQDYENNVMLTISQNQSHNSVSFFKLPVPVKFKNSVRDTIIVFPNTFSGQTFNINLGFHADSLIFDPDHWLVDSLQSVSFITSVSNNLKSNNLIAVYPNPANEICYINYIDLKISKVELLETTGNLCWRSFVTSAPKSSLSSGQFTLDLKSFNSGIYILKLYSDKGVVVRKIVKK